MTIPKEFECPICLNLLFKPVTTSCGHNFCKQCIDRTLLVTQNCPICKLQLTNDYSPNLLLVQIINERFPEEINSRYNFTIPSQNQSTDADLNSPDKLFLVPVYYQKFYMPPLFDGTISLTIQTLKDYRMIQYATVNGSNLVLCRRLFNTTMPIGTLVKITSNRIGATNDIIPVFPVVVEVTAIHRVKMSLPVTLTDFNFYHCDYTIYNDKWSLKKEYNLNLSLSEPERSIFDELNSIQDNLSNLCKNYDSIHDAVKRFEKLNHQLTGYNRYFACVILINASITLLKRQLNDGQRSLRQRFESLYGSLPILADSNPEPKELEILSLYLSKVVAASSKTKWNWYSLDDTFERVLSISQLIVLSRDKNVLMLRSCTLLSELFNSVDPLLSGVAFLLLLLFIPRLYRIILYG